MAKPVVVGGHNFRTQKDALAHVASLRDRYKDGELIQGDDAEFMRELLLLHPEATQKIGCGVAGFSVATDSVYGKTRHFVVRRTDESATDFSFHSCIKGADERRDKLQALRVAIAPQIEAFKAESFAGQHRIKCAVRGKLTTFADAHVDHEPPATFAALVQRWLAEECLAVDGVPISEAKDNEIVSTMSDPAQRESWQVFHQAHARLRITCRQANLSDVRVASRGGV